MGRVRRVGPNHESTAHASDVEALSVATFHCVTQKHLPPLHVFKEAGKSSPDTRSPSFLHRKMAANRGIGGDDCSDDAPTRRIQRLRSHLDPAPSTESRLLLYRSPCARVMPALPDPSVLSSYIRGRHRDVQERVYRYFVSRPDLHTPLEIGRDEHRELCMKQLVGLVRGVGIKPLRLISDDPAQYFAVMEAAGAVDMSLGVKFGVQYRSAALLLLIAMGSSSPFPNSLALIFTFRGNSGIGEFLLGFLPVFRQRKDGFGGAGELFPIFCPIYLFIFNSDE